MSLKGPHTRAFFYANKILTSAASGGMGRHQRNKMNIKRTQRGFTLIELVVVIILLGVVGVIATARFQDMANGALLVTQEAIAASIGSGSSINYAEGTMDGTFTQAIDNVSNNCATIAGNLLLSGLPTGWTINGTITACGTVGTTNTECTIVDNPVTLAPFTISLTCTG